ncbi:methylmalonyl-CoA mutase family protein [Lutibacter sp. A80]|uniref:methylmalonyl-CoA mutase family protein n=1 Tax=Lutibacter sp. A80 TaxID=2918453 RepID=UPI001F06B3D0|nr:methylmalonyl-CoA mutase family protein [Lutibacter sp. A80]UMB60214.1 methylmalonyl-CoA mutase family protein [Lutibacter sp. A80]
MKRKDFSDIEITAQNKKNTFFGHENYIAGTAPFLRGINTTMYLEKPLKTQVLVDFPSPEKSNLFIKEHILRGYKYFILTINTDNSTGINSGIFTPSIEAMKILLKGIALKELSITLNTNNSILSVLSLFIAATKQLSIKQESLYLSVNLTPENLIVDAKFNQNTIEAILNYTTKNLPNFNTISIDTHQISKGKTKENDIAYFLVTTFTHLNYCITKGFKIDTIASKISYNYTIEKDYFLEISKIRATRMLWAKMLQQFKPKQQQSLALKIHSLNHFSNYNKAITALFGGIQSIVSTNEISQFIEQETLISKTIDPWAGSTNIEKLTEDTFNNTWQLFEEITQKNSEFPQLQQQENSTKPIFKTKNLLELIIKKIEKNSTLELLYKNIKN